VLPGVDNLAGRSERPGDLADLDDLGAGADDDG
jgi:hypothetical protein